MTAKLQQLDVLVAQGQGIADATRQVGISESRYYRWRQERGALKRDEVNKPEHETPKGSAQDAARSTPPPKKSRRVEGPGG